MHEALERRPSIKYGLLLAATIIVIYTITYFVAPTYLFSLILKLVLGIVPTIYFILLALKKKKAMHEGSLMFAEAFQSSLLTYIIGTFLSSLFFYILTNHIDPDLVPLGIQTLADTSLAVIDKMGGNINDTDEFKQIFMEKVNPFTLSMTMLDWLSRLFFPGAVLTLILAAIGKS